MAATFPVGILTAATVIIALFLYRTTTVTCQFPMILSLERAIPLNDEMKLSELRALDNARHRMLLQSSNDSGFSLEGTYDPFVAGLYYTKVQLGSPPREFHLQVDTGSDPLWVTCSACSGCPDKTELEITLSSFDPGKSSTYSPVTCTEAMCNSEYESPEAVCSKHNRCTYTFQYADASASAGYYVSDLIHYSTPISNGSSPDIFGCSTELRGNLGKNGRGVDGIIGFGQGEISVISQLSSKGLVPKVFSHCLRGDDHGGGTLVLGQIEDLPIPFTPLVQGSGSHYNLDMKGIDVKGQKLAIDSSVFETLDDTPSAVVDSGTTLAYLPDGVYEAFINAISSAAPEELLTGTYVNTIDGSHCFLTKTSISEVFPNVSLNFDGGVSMVLKPKDYLVRHMTLSDGEIGWCIAIQKMQGPQGFTILGDIVLKDRIVVYDLAGQRIGWADYDCSKPFAVSAKLNSAAGWSVGTSGGWPHALPFSLASLISIFFLF